MQRRPIALAPNRALSRAPKKEPGRAPPAARRTVADLTQELQRVNAVAEGLDATAQSLWQQAQAQHSLPAAQLQQVAHCFSARLSQDLYPYRPKLSILLQYWKRPNASKLLDEFMAPLLRCREQVGAGWPGSCLLAAQI